MTSPNPTGREGLVEPALWGIFNPDTGHWRNKVFDRQEDARNYADRHTDNYCRLFAIPLFGPDALATSQARVAELEREREGPGSANASRAAMGPQPHVAPEAEPSAAWSLDDYRQALSGSVRYAETLEGVLERIVGPRNADHSYLALFQEDQRWASEVLDDPAASPTGDSDKGPGASVARADMTQEGASDSQRKSEGDS